MKGYLGIEKEEQSRAGGALSWCTLSSLSTELVELSSLSTPLSLPVAQWPQVREMAADESTDPPSLRPSSQSRLEMEGLSLLFFMEVGDDDGPSGNFMELIGEDVRSGSTLVESCSFAEFECFITRR
ncbi:hypothetical protein Dimus_025174 [Dionaea muscipula]